MSKYLLLGLLVVAVAIGTYVGCDGANARVGVAKDAAIKKIDDLSLIHISEPTRPY